MLELQEQDKLSSHSAIISSHSLNRSNSHSKNLDDTLDDADELKDDKKSRGVGKIYTEIQDFDNLDLALSLIKDGGIDGSYWKRGKTDLVKQATVINFQCTGGNCPKKLRVLIKKSETIGDRFIQSGSILLSSDEHEHSNANGQEKKKKISQQVKDRIYELCFLNLTPNQIIQKLTNEKLEPPSKVDLNNLLKSIRKKELGKKLPSLNELKEWCEQHKLIPDDDDEVFVGNYSVEAKLEEKDFRIFLTTKRLMAFTQHVSRIYLICSIITNN